MQMTSTPSPTWYDVLGVPRDASAEQIKAAWRAATDKFEPGSGSGQFRMFSEAADVLLDPERRAAYDATLDAEHEAELAPPPPAPVDERADEDVDEHVVATADDRAPETAGTTVTATGRRLGLPALRRRPRIGPAPDGEQGTGRDGDGQPPSRRMKLVAAVLAVLSIAALALAGWYAVQVREDARISDARDDAPVAAEQAAKALFSYDYRRLPADQKRAEGHVTDEFGKKYLQSFEQLEKQKDGSPGLAVQSKTVVTANVLGSGVVDAEADRVRVLVYVNQVSEKPDKDPQIFQNRVALTMAREGSRWLVDDVKSY